MGCSTRRPLGVRAFSFFTPVLTALSRASDTWDLVQLCDFAAFYARRGDADARTALYRTWDRNPDPTAPWLAEEQILRFARLWRAPLWMTGRKSNHLAEPR